MLHGVRSDAVLAIAICGRPSNAVRGTPAHPRPVDVGVAIPSRVPVRTAQPLLHLSRMRSWARCRNPGTQPTNLTQEGPLRGRAVVTGGPSGLSAARPRVARAGELLRKEATRTMQLLGVRQVADLDATSARLRDR